MSSDTHQAIVKLVSLIKSGSLGTSPVGCVASTGA